MNPCVCGHWHAATCPHCGCSIYEHDDGTDGKPARYWGQRETDDSEGRPL